MSRFSQYCAIVLMLVFYTRNIALKISSSENYFFIHILLDSNMGKCVIGKVGITNFCHLQSKNTKNTIIKIEQRNKF